LAKAYKPYGTSVRELKAAAFEESVRQEIAARQAKQASKIARLKALRLADGASDISRIERA
jgi:hypothetical protein